LSSIDRSESNQEQSRAKQPNKTKQMILGPPHSHSHSGQLMHKAPVLERTIMEAKRWPLIANFFHINFGRKKFKIQFG